MPFPLLFWAGAAVVGGLAVGAVAEQFAPARRELTTIPVGPFGTILSARDVEAQRLQLEREEQFAREARFSREVELKQAEARAAQLRFENQQRAEEAQRVALFERQRFEDALKLEEIKELKRLEFQAENERQLRELELQREKLQVEAALRTQEARSREISSFVSRLPQGFTAGIGPGGDFVSIPPGSSLSPADVARGFEPLPILRETTTAERITTVPGVFVGPEFQFKTIEQANLFLLSSLIKGNAPKGGGFRVQ